tara:strand:+ start:415 stop:723 length:309 start_codon:yes stop_codon:yes gene_type:complete
MRLVINIGDNAVGVDGTFSEGLDLSQCGLPENFRAFQWNEHGGDTGHIEYDSPNVANDQVNAIPAWATACIAVWQAKLDQEAAALAAAEAAAAEAAEAENAP